MKFKRADRDAIIVILLVAIGAIILFPLVGDRSEGTTERQNKTERYNNKDHKSQYYAQPEQNTKEVFPFDPNTADSTTLLRLGLRPWQVRNIYKYRAKGGRYRYKEDFARLYGLTIEDYRRLEPYIRIKPEVMAADVIPQHDGSGGSNSSSGLRGSSLGSGGKAGINSNAIQSSSSNTRHSSSKMRQGDPPVDINTADTTTLKRIPGIGSYFARRIVELRQRRRVFASPEDLLVIRNFPETALTYMTASQNFQKVHINSASLQQLRSHPLINYTQAMDIMKYRRTNGTIHSEKDLSFLPSFTEEQLKRLTPFLLFD